MSRVPHYCGPSNVDVAGSIVAYGGGRRAW